MTRKGATTKTAVTNDGIGAVIALVGVTIIFYMPRKGEKSIWSRVYTLFELGLLNCLVYRVCVFLMLYHYSLDHLLLGHILLHLS
jgi:hypothetical protein